MQFFYPSPLTLQFRGIARSLRQGQPRHVEISFTVCRPTGPQGADPMFMKMERNPARDKISQFVRFAEPDKVS